MSSTAKYIDHAHDVLGMDRSASPNIAPQGKWFSCQDVRFRDMRIEIFPAMKLRYSNPLTLTAEYFEMSSEDSESLCWLNKDNAFYARSGTPNSVQQAIIINRTGSFPTDVGSTRYMCSIRGCGANGLGTFSVVTITIGAGAPPTTFTVTDGVHTSSSYGFASSVTVVLNGTSFIVGFVPSETDNSFNNYVAGDTFTFQQSYTFANNDAATAMLRPQFVKWFDQTIMVRGKQMYKRQANVYMPLMHNAMVSQSFNSFMYCEIFQKHLILGGGLNGISVAYSQLNNFDDFLPTLFNESDSYPILRFNKVLKGGYYITGIRVLGVYCYVYTPETIWRIIYVGLPNVMFFQEVSTPVGNQFAYGLVAAGKKHYFISAANFHEFDGNGIVDIGNPIKLFFFADISTDIVLQNKLWSFYNSRSEEVMWFYCDTTSTGNINKCLYYHIPTKSWYYRNVPDTKWVYDMYFSNNLVDVQGVNQPISGDLFYQVNNVGTVSDILPIEETSNFINYAPQNPTLESNDYTYDSPQNTKDINTMYLDTAYDKNVLVYTSFRRYISDPINFLLKYTWNRTNTTGRISLPRESGGCMRYQFKFPGNGSFVTRSRIYTWGENVQVNQAEH